VQERPASAKTIRDTTATVYGVYATWLRHTLTVAGVVFGFAATFITSRSTMMSRPEKALAVIALVSLGYSILCSLIFSLEMSTVASRASIETDEEVRAQAEDRRDHLNGRFYVIQSTIVCFVAGVLALILFALWDSVIPNWL
jgi:hypothetical protein